MLYYILFVCLYLLSLLPFWLLYIISDGLYFLIYKLAKYRVGVVRENLLQSFPDKTENERRIIEKKFYQNLCDSIMETIKMFSISRAELNKRVTCNWEIFDEMTRQQRNGQGLMSHQFNWEWSTLICNWNNPRQFTGIYLPLSNNAFDKILYYLRSRANMTLIPVQEMQQQMAAVQKKEVLWGFIADQNPSDPKRASWHEFLHRTTAFFKGPEFVARRYNNIVYFGEIIKRKRGYYHIEMKLAFDQPQQTAPGEITEAFVRFLEDSIKRQPENWVWSHRRWKHVYQDANT